MRGFDDVDTPISLGVSGCLLGWGVRHDGSHRRDRFLVEELAQRWRLVGFCPEAEAGLGVPRPTLRLVGNGAAPRLEEPSSRADRTELLVATARRIVERLVAEDVSGVVLKRASPSCGLERVKVYGEGGVPVRVGQGVFARVLKERLPHLPVEEEGRLYDARLRESFLVRVVARRRFTDLARAPSLARLLAFHRAHKLLLLAHDERRLREMGRLLGRARDLPLGDVVERYEALLFAALSEPAGERGHQNALHHAAGFLKRSLTHVERRGLHALIEAHGDGRVPLAVPRELLRLFVEEHHPVWLEGQLYLADWPDEWRLERAL